MWICDLCLFNMNSSTIWTSVMYIFWFVHHLMQQQMKSPKGCWCHAKATFQTQTFFASMLPHIICKYIYAVEPPWFKIFFPSFNFQLHQFQAWNSALNFPHSIFVSLMFTYAEETLHVGFICISVLIVLFFHDVRIDWKGKCAAFECVT